MKTVHAGEPFNISKNTRSTAHDVLGAFAVAMPAEALEEEEMPRRPDFSTGSLKDPNLGRLWLSASPPPQSMKATLVYSANVFNVAAFGNLVLIIKFELSEPYKFFIPSNKSMIITILKPRLAFPPVSESNLVVQPFMFYPNAVIDSFPGRIGDDTSATVTYSWPRLSPVLKSPGGSPVVQPYDPAAARLSIPVPVKQAFLQNGVYGDGTVVVVFALVRPSPPTPIQAGLLDTTNSLHMVSQGSRPWTAATTTAGASRTPLLQQAAPRHTTAQGGCSRAMHRPAHPRQTFCISASFHEKYKSAPGPGEPSVHQGVDVATRPGGPVRAPFRGTLRVLQLQVFVEVGDL